LSDTYPRTLNGHGCLYGQKLAEDFAQWKKTLQKDLEKHYEDRMDKIEAKLNRLMWAAFGAAVTLATSSVLLALNLLL